MTVRFERVARIRAPIERVFDLSLDLDLHAASMASSHERAIAGVTTGRLGLGEEVTWRARHLGVTWTMTSRVAELERPARFVDEQARGPFARFRHEHTFVADGPVTVMTDLVEFAAPLGIVGLLGERLLLEWYVRRLIDRRNRYLADAVERE
jgi:ligand-binding SRPBCC domain-containing protein